MKQLSNIDVSLSRGQIYGKKQLAVGWSAIIIAALFSIIGIISLIVSLIEWDSQIFICAIVCALIGIAFLILLIYHLYKDKKTKKEVLLWLEDAIQIHAFSNKINSFRAGFQPIAVKISVSFHVNGVAYVRESTVQAFGGKKGYSGAFKKYADRPIEILYSPKYDEVLILKNENQPA